MSSDTFVCSQVMELQRRVQGTPHAAHLQIIQGDVMKVSVIGPGPDHADRKNNSCRPDKWLGFASGLTPALCYWFSSVASLQ